MEEQDVGRFQIAMNNRLRTKETEAIRELTDDVRDLGKFELALLLLDIAFQITKRRVLHHQIQIHIFLETVIETDNTRIRHLTHHRGFAQQCRLQTFANRGELHLLQRNCLSTMLIIAF